MEIKRVLFSLKKIANEKMSIKLILKTIDMFVNEEIKRITIMIANEDIEEVKVYCVGNTLVIYDQDDKEIMNLEDNEIIDDKIYVIK